MKLILTTYSIQCNHVLSFQYDSNIKILLGVQRSSCAKPLQSDVCSWCESQTSSHFKSSQWLPQWTTQVYTYLQQGSLSSNANETFQCCSSSCPTVLAVLKKQSVVLSVWPCSNFYQEEQCVHTCLETHLSSMTHRSQVTVTFLVWPQAVISNKQ